MQKTEANVATNQTRKERQKLITPSHMHEEGVCMQRVDDVTTSPLTLLLHLTIPACTQSTLMHPYICSSYSPPPPNLPQCRLKVQLPIARLVPVIHNHKMTQHRAGAGAGHKHPTAHEHDLAE